MDKNSKKLVKYFSDNGMVAYYANQLPAIANELDIPIEQIQSHINYLEQQGYVEYTRSSNGFRICFHPTHLALQYKAIRKWDTVLYFRNHWLDIIAVAIAIASFVTSCMK